MQNVILSVSIQGKKELNVKLVTDDGPEATDPVVALVRVRGETIAVNRAELRAFMGALKAADDEWSGA